MILKVLERVRRIDHFIQIDMNARVCAAPIGNAALERVQAVELSVIPSTPPRPAITVSKTGEAACVQPVVQAQARQSLTVETHVGAWHCYVKWPRKTAPGLLILHVDRFPSSDRHFGCPGEGIPYFHLTGVFANHDVRILAVEH